MKSMILLLLLSTMSFASEAAPLCSKKYASETYWKLKEMPIQDKTMHCTLSCDLTLKCGSTVSMGLGIAKEIYDIFGAGNAEWEDLKADIRGVKIARQGLVKNFKDCLSACSGLYEPK